MSKQSSTLLCLLCFALLEAGCALNKSRVNTVMMGSPLPKSEVPLNNTKLESPVVAVSHEHVSEPIPELLPHVESQSLSLEALEQLALQHNPAIKQMSAAAAKARGIWEQVGLKPNPQLGYFADEIGNADSAGLQGAFVSQTVVTANKLGQNRRVAAHDVESVNWRLESQRLRVLTDVRTLFFKALAAQQRLKLAREFREVAAKGLSIAKDRLEVGGTRPDVLQSEIQLGEIDLLIKKSEFELTSAWNELVAIAGIPELAPSPLVGNLESYADTKDLEVVFYSIISENPLLRAAQQQVCRAKANLDRQKAQVHPNLTGQLGVGHDDSTGDEFASVQLTMPLPVHNRNQGNIRAAYAAYCEATQNVERIRMQLRGMFARVMQEYQIAAASVRQYELTILPRAKESQTLITETYMAGEVDFLRVLTARKAFFDANLQYLAALNDLAAANAKIDGLLLTGSLTNITSFNGDDGLRGQALSGR